MTPAQERLARWREEYGGDRQPARCRDHFQGDRCRLEAGHVCDHMGAHHDWDAATPGLHGGLANSAQFRRRRAFQRHHRQSHQARVLNHGRRR